MFNEKFKQICKIKLSTLNTKRNDLKKFNEEKNKKNIKDNQINKDISLKGEKKYVKQINNNIYTDNDKINTDLNIKKNIEPKRKYKTINEEVNKKSSMIIDNNYNIFNKRQIMKLGNKYLNQNFKENRTINNNLYRRQPNNSDIFNDNYNKYNDKNYNYNKIVIKEKYKKTDNISNEKNIFDYNNDDSQKIAIKYKGNNNQIINNNNFNINNDNLSHSNWNVISVNQNSIKINEDQLKKSGKIYRGINNHALNSYHLINKDKEDTLDEDNNNSDFSDSKERLKKKINKKKENLDYINNGKRSYNYEINNNNNNYYYLINPNNGLGSTFEINNVNIHKNKSSSRIYCSPHKIDKIDNQRTIDDPNINYFNEDKICDNINEYEKIGNKNNYIYKKVHRNISCIKPKKHIKNLESEFKNENYDNKSIKINHQSNNINVNIDNKIINKNKNKNNDLSFNSPIPSINKRNERNSISYMNSISSNKRLKSQNKNNYINNENKNIEVNELFNRFKKENSKVTTLQNSEEVTNSTIKYSDKKYFYQTQDKNNYKENNSEFTNYFNKSNVLKVINKTYQIKKQNQKNKLIYDNKFNSFDKNNDNKESNNEGDDDFKEKISSYYNRKKQYDNQNNNDYNSKTNDEGDNCLKLDACSDYINFDRPKISNNKIIMYNKNSKNITKTIRPKKIITDSLKRKKYSNSFNNEIIESECDNYINKVDSKIQKKSQRLILDRSLTNCNNQCFYRKSSIGLNHYNNNNNKINNNKDINSSLFSKKIINSTVKTSPKLIDDSTSKNSNNPTKLEKEDFNNNYFYKNCKTKDYFYKDTNNIYRKTNNIDNSIESSQTDNKKILNRKKNSQNHFGFNNFRTPFENNKNVEFNRTCYLKKPMDKNQNKYCKKNSNYKINSNDEIQKLKNGLTDNFTINSSNSNNNKFINFSNDKDNKDNNNIIINDGIENEDFILKDDFSYIENDLKEKVYNNHHYFFKKLYCFNIKKPKSKISYIYKYIKNKKRNKKTTNNSSINISNISENKNNDNSLFNISFNNNKNKKQNRKNKDISDEKILNDKNVNSDFELKYNFEDIEFVNSNDNNKISISNIKKKDNESNFNDAINFDLSEEKEENINIYKKDNNAIIKKNLNKCIQLAGYIPEEKDKDSKDSIKMRSLQINVDNHNNNQIELFNNYLSNSTSKKDNILYKNEYLNNKNDISEKISLLTKKLNNIFSKNEDNNKNNNNNNEKKIKIQKSMTQKEFVLGYSKLNDIFNKKSNNSSLHNSLKERNRSNRANNNETLFINDKIIEEMNDFDKNDDLDTKPKTYNCKVKIKNQYLEDDEDQNIDELLEDNIKAYNIEQILSFKNNKLSLKDNLLNENLKCHINDLLKPEKTICKLNIKTLNDDLNIDKNILNHNIVNEIKENKIEDKIKDLLKKIKENNIDKLSEQLLNIILYNDDVNNSQYKLKKSIISNNYMDNITIFVNIIFDKVIYENIDTYLYSRLFNKINSILMKKPLNENKINNLGTIVINEYIKKIDNKEFLNDINKKDNEKLKQKFLDLINFIFKLISYNLINIEESFNIFSVLIKNYEIKEDNMKYLYLEGSIDLFNFLIKTIFDSSKIENNILQIINNIENKLKEIIEDKNLIKNLKDKISNLIEKKKKKFDKNEYKKEINNKGINNKEIKNKDINNKEINNKEINNKEINNKEINNNTEIKNKEINNKDINNKEINNKEINNKEINIKDINNEEINNKVISNKEINNKEINNEEINNKVIINKEIKKDNNLTKNEKEIDNKENIKNININNNEIIIDKKINENENNKITKKIENVELINNSNENKIDKPIKILSTGNIEIDNQNKIIPIENIEDLGNTQRYNKTNTNFYKTYNKLLKNKINDEPKINNNEEIDGSKNDNINNNNNTKNNYLVTHKKKGKNKSKSTEKRIIKNPVDLLKQNEEIYTKENENNKKYKEEIKEDFEKYFEFLEKEGITKKEDIYDELNDSYNWKIIDDLIMQKKVKLEEITKIYIEICKNKKDFNHNDIFKANEYIKTIIEYYSTILSKNQTDIFHLNMIELYMGIDDIVNNSLYMHEIMGNLLFILLKNKLYFMKDLNNFIDKIKETQINIAKIVKYSIIASGSSSKQYHNDFKFTKFFNNNDIFIVYVTNELNNIKNK